jgi:hypothetical protein
VWKDPNKPNAAAAVFPEGTVSCKLLFSQANVDQVPYLAGSLEWDAYIYTNTETPANPNGARSLQKLRLLQIDVAVRDKRVDSTTGWVFGTFIYNGDVAGKTVWDRMVPVGAMWGNDEGVTAADVNGGKPIKESTINHGSNLPLYSVQSPRQHLGWAGRLNGPVDNPASSCLSCHSTAQWPIASQMVPLAKDPPGSAGWMRWFRNIGPAQPFDSGCTSLDYSLQLAAGMANYYEWSAITHSRGGVDTGAMDPSAPTCTSTNAFMSTTPNHHTHKVTRDEAEELTEQ